MAHPAPKAESAVNFTGAGVRVDEPQGARSSSVAVAALGLNLAGAREEFIAAAKDASVLAGRLRAGDANVEPGHIASAVNEAAIHWNAYTARIAKWNKRGLPALDERGALSVKGALDAEVKYLFSDSVSWLGRLSFVQWALLRTALTILGGSQQMLDKLVHLMDSIQRQPMHDAFMEAARRVRRLAEAPELEREPTQVLPAIEAAATRWDALVRLCYRLHEKESDAAQDAQERLGRDCLRLLRQQGVDLRYLELKPLFELLHAQFSSHVSMGVGHLGETLGPVEALMLRKQSHAVEYMQSAMNPCRKHEASTSETPDDLMQAAIDYWKPKLVGDARVALRDRLKWAIEGREQPFDVLDPERLNTLRRLCDGLGFQEGNELIESLPAAQAARPLVQPVDPKRETEVRDLWVQATELIESWAFCLATNKGNVADVPSVHPPDEVARLLAGRAQDYEECCMRYAGRELPASLRLDPDTMGSFQRDLQTWVRHLNPQAPKELNSLRTFVTDYIAIREAPAAIASPVMARPVRVIVGGGSGVTKAANTNQAADAKPRSVSSSGEPTWAEGLRDAFNRKPSGDATSP